MADADLPRDTERRIERFVRDWLADEKLPGASLAVARDDEVVYADGFGSRDLAENRPATADTLYGIGSVTKSFAGLAVMQLQEAGELDVNAPATDYLEIDLPEEIELHHLLTHSSGLPSLGVSEALIARQAGVAELGVPLGSREDFHAHVEGGLDEVAADPGERFMYCNTGYTLLGEAIEEITGRSFAAYVESEILSPLGMERSTFDGEAYAADDDSATPYWMGGEGEETGSESTSDATAPEPTELPVRELSKAPGGLKSSVRELVRYLACQRNGGELDGARLVGPDAFEQMHAEHAGFTPDDEWSVAVLCNGAADPGPKSVALGVFATLLGGEPEDAPAFARQERIGDLTGTYETYRGIRTAEVSETGGTLQLEFTDPFGEEPSPLIPADDSLEEPEFYQLSSSGERQTAEFDVREDGTDLYVDRWRLRKVD
ncbi:serine hydrolase [Halobacteriales archaeon SW_6_65_15]|nr:MAG: serine hydrolase [Halobacteriales archaeon SW_6_65_15]